MKTPHLPKVSSTFYSKNIFEFIFQLHFCPKPLSANTSLVALWIESEIKCIIGTISITVYLYTSDSVAF